MYPMGPNQVAIGLVVGLDYHGASLDVHELLQRMKLHPLFRPYLEGGQLLEWGAKTIPEGGFYALPERRHGDGVLLVGDAGAMMSYLDRLRIAGGVLAGAAGRTRLRHRRRLPGTRLPRGVLLAAVICPSPDGARC